jgi:hypothetical protein
MVSIRRWHSYIGLFVAPSVLFFALTGAAQLFSLHEAHGGYQPLALLEKLSSVHKDQVFALGDHHPPPDAAPHAGAEPPQIQTPGPGDHDDQPSVSTFLLKGFFLVVAIALVISTGFGLWMGLARTQRKAVGWLLVATGSLIPVVLLLV